MFGKDVSVGSDEGFEIAWSGCRAATAWIEVFGDDGFDETFFALEFVDHLVVAKVSGGFGFVGAFDDEFEALVEFVFDLDGKVVSKAVQRVVRSTICNAPVFDTQDTSRDSLPSTSSALPCIQNSRLQSLRRSDRSLR